MDHWVTIMTFQYNHEAYLVKTKLESEGVMVNLLDEYISQIQPFYAGATGGIKLQVKDADIIKAKYILSEIGQTSQRRNSENKLIAKIDELTSKFPLLNMLSVEARILVILALVVIIIVLPIFIVQY